MRHFDAHLLQKGVWNGERRVDPTITARRTRVVFVRRMSQDHIVTGLQDLRIEHTCGDLVRLKAFNRVANVLSSSDHETEANEDDGGEEPMEAEDGIINVNCPSLDEALESDEQVQHDDGRQKRAKALAPFDSTISRSLSSTRADGMNFLALRALHFATWR